MFARDHVPDAHLSDLARQRMVNGQVEMSIFGTREVVGARGRNMDEARRPEPVRARIWGVGGWEWCRWEGVFFY